jgi:hypothetical protein
MLDAALDSCDLPTGVALYQVRLSSSVASPVARSNCPTGPRARLRLNRCGLPAGCLVGLSRNSQNGQGFPCPP